MEVKIDVPDGVSGDWRVESFEVKDRELSEMVSLMQHGRGVPAGQYKRLMRGGQVVMSNTPDEIQDFLHFVYKAKGMILVNGLGLGVLLKKLLDKPEVTKVTVIEKSPDVINLVGPTYRNDKRVEIIHADAFSYQPPKGERYDCVWHDIWDNLCADNLEEMKKLHRKYGRRTRFQESWGRCLCERYAKRDKSFF
jgi:spermidine synthase